MGRAKNILQMIGKALLCLLFALICAGIVSIPIIGGIVYYFVSTGRTDSNDIMDFIMNDPSVNTGFIFAQGVGFIVGVWLVYMLFDRKKGWSLGLRGVRFVPDLSLGAVIGMVLMSIVFVLIWLFGGMKIISAGMNAAVVKSLAWSMLLFVLVAVSEELFCRGYVQGLVKHSYGTKIAIVVSTLLFAVLHGSNPGALDNPVPMLNLLLAGLLLALCREVSGGLWLPIGLHFTWNFFQGNVFGFAVSGMNIHSVIVGMPTGSPYISGGTFGAEGSALATIVLTAAVFVINKYDLKRKRIA